MKNAITDMRDKGKGELEREVGVLRKEIAQDRLASKTNPPKNTNAIAQKKKELAQYLTVLRSITKESVS